MDDSAAVRGAIRQFVELNTGLRVCENVADGITAIEKSREFCCELALLDINMVNPNGIQTATALRRALPSIKLVGFSVDAELGQELIDNGVFDAVVSKFYGLPRLADTLKRLMPDSS